MLQKQILAILCSLVCCFSAFAQPTVIQTSEGVFTTRLKASRLPVPKSDDAFHFVIFGDRTGGNRSGLKVLRQAVQDTNLLDPDFVLTVGDLIQGYNRPQQWKQQASEFRRIMERLNRPWFPVAGNHDVYWDLKDSGRPVEHHEKNYELTFGPLWYAFEHKNTGFIVLYTDEGDLQTGEKGFNKGRLQNMSPQQIEFLGKALKRFESLPRVFLAMHHPRWIGGGYSGSNWPQVHEMLVKAGNVSAVFAGHIHHMRYDPKDGIDYYALATTGGNLKMELPEIGYLHHFNLVTVRPDDFAVATVPVGAVMDPEKFTPEFTAEVEKVRRMTANRASDPLEISTTGQAAGEYRLSFQNPGNYPLEISVNPSTIGGWQISPDHQHLTLAPGKTGGMDLYVYRGKREAGESRADFWSDFQFPEVEMTTDYLHDSARIRLPAKRIPIDVRVETPATEIFRDDSRQCLEFPGKAGPPSYDQIKSDCVRIDPRDILLNQAPFTVEAWVFPTANNGSQAVLAKTENAEFAIFLEEGKPLFDVHLGGSYVTAKSDQVLPLNQWSHLAGVFSGEQVRLFVNGQLMAAQMGQGQRTVNRLPLFIGADPNQFSQPTRLFTGKIDEVRVSQGERYTKDFRPSRRFISDDNTVLLLHCDQASGPFLFDDSKNPARVLRFGNVKIKPDSSIKGMNR